MKSIANIGEMTSGITKCTQLPIPISNLKSILRIISITERQAAIIFSIKSKIATTNSMLTMTNRINLFIQQKQNIMTSSIQN